MRSLWRPIKMMRSAPRRLADSTAHRPTAPSPMTVTGGAGADARRAGTVVAGREHVRKGEQGREKSGVLADRQRHQRASRLRDPDGFALAPVDTVAAPEAAVAA